MKNYLVQGNRTGKKKAGTMRHAGENRKLKILSDKDYVIMYTEALKNNSQLFEQQRLIINSQMQMSRSFFQKAFAGREFKEAAREYLREMGLLK